MDFDSRHTLEKELFELMAPTVFEEGCQLIAVELAGDPKGPVLKVFIDREEGVNIGDCSRVTRALSPELDVADPLPGKYRLEVSSPGIDRPVYRAEDFDRFTGLRVKVKMAPGEPRKRYAGVLRGQDDAENVRVEVDGTLHLLCLDRIDRIRLDLDLEEYQKLRRNPNSN